MKTILTRLTLIAAFVLAACQPAAPPTADQRAIAAVMHGAYDRDGATLEAGPIAVSGDHAVADWTQGDAGGRALFHKQDGAWHLLLCSGDALRTAEGLAQVGVTHDAAEAIAGDLARQETAVSAERLRLMSAFAGIVRMDAPTAATEINDIVVTNAWAATTPNGATVGAGYLTIVNGTGQADALIGASSSRAPSVQIHEMAIRGNVMEMRQVTRLALPSGGRVTLAPGGHHIMFMNISSGFAAGQSIPLTLRFEHHAPIEVTLPVRDRTAAHEAMTMEGEAHDQH